ncbi:hypothetical protein ERO13_D09G216300v2 [Gossypium hirsutum]|uniref:Protein FANTASTIC FOUR 3 n=1 Tax=Gossypium hirsutum TaxID=3635 RepID=A0A1U8LPT1_GOSHI|nr:protein FANTASTIC FOUR 3-like [Gossypium hirsutum]KAG4131508.1 hypothetical protein ERO13_D09G216300v2 [Gossypium hirsutum]
MATIVCHQGLQSCLESQLVEPRALRLTLSSARPRELISKSCSVNPEPGGWSLLQALFNSPQSSKGVQGNENTYVHPLVKRSLSSLSEKSLELCTENLGSETGSDEVLEDDVFALSSHSSQGGNPPTWKSGQPLGGTKKAIAGDFPPPLTTISGSESLRVRSHRENGRLVIQAVKAPSNNPIFQAERSNGRLRLHLLKYSTSSIDHEEEKTADVENDNNTNNNENDDEEEQEEEYENDDNYIAEEEEPEKEEDGETATLQRSWDGRGRYYCKEGETEKQGIVKMGGYNNINSFILDLPV